MDHLKIDRAHIHGYSMGGAITGQLLAMIPQRFITAGFGGSGIHETDPKVRAQAEAMDAALPKAQGEDAAGMERFRARVAQMRPANAPPIASTPPQVDVTTLTVPILGVNGSFDNPYAKTQRLWREARVFENVILPGKTHLTAIATSDERRAAALHRGDGALHRRERSAMTLRHVRGLAGQTTP